jgi:hypothetical protein
MAGLKRKRVSGLMNITYNINGCVMLYLYVCEIGGGEVFR